MSLAEKLGKKFVVTVELDPPRGVSIEKTLQGASLLKGVDAVNIADFPMARVRMSSIALAHLLHEKLNLEAILHFTCRDRNLLGLQGDLLGAWALGVENILALTGDPPSVGDYPNATAVFDVNSEGLVRLVKRLNNGTDLAGNKLNEAPHFCIGVALNPGSSNLDKEIDRFKGKIEAGANFAQTQPLYDISVLERFRDKTPDLDLPIIVGLLPLRNPRHTEYLHNEVPGISIPDEIRARMQAAGEDGGREEGITIAREFLEKAKSLAAGAYLMPPFADYSMAMSIIQGILDAKDEID